MSVEIVLVRQARDEGRLLGREGQEASERGFVGNNGAMKTRTGWP